MSVRQLGFGLATVGLAIFQVALARPLTDGEKACTFRKPVVIGASISAETARTIPFYSSAVDALALRKWILFLPSFGFSPAKPLIRLYGRGGEEADLSKMFTRNDPDLGSSQINSLMNGDRRSTFDSASVVVGVDAFYWDAIWDKCGYESGTGVEKTIGSFIDVARAKSIKLILGNVPQEEPSKVIIDSEALGVPGLWYRPVPRCVDSINRTLLSLCKADRGCYVVDLNAMAQALNKGEKLRMRNGEEHGLYAMRPDGVHLSVLGRFTSTREWWTRSRPIRRDATDHAMTSNGRRLRSSLKTASAKKMASPSVCISSGASTASG